MDLVNIVCPKCDYRKSMERQKVPQGITKKICPNCQLGFLLIEELGEQKQ